MFLTVTTGRILLAAGGERAVMLLSVLYCTGQHPAAKNYLAPNNANSAEVSMETALHDYCKKS